MNLEDLKAPFDISQIKFRIGSTNRDKTQAMALAYIDARDVEDRLDQVCGQYNWQCEHKWSDGKKLTCSIGIHFNQWVWKSCGAGDTAVEGDKGAFSDSFKRAGVKWGIARYLYRMGASWHAITPKGKSHVFTDPALKELHAAYEVHIGPARTKLFDKAYYRNEAPMETLLDLIEGGVCSNLKEAAKAWKEISESDQRVLWLADSKGGVFSKKQKTIIQSREFRS